MKLKPLGRTDLRVTEICLGTMTWGSQNTEAEGHAQIDMALDAGINFMDTAEIYAVPRSPETSGRTEEIIGNWFKKTGKRDQWILASKVAGGPVDFIRNGTRTSGKTLREAFEASLSRLQTDYIDLYQIHWAGRGSYNFDGSWTYQPHKQDTADALANIEDMLETLGALVKEGKLGHVGVSNETTWGMAQWLRIAEARGLPRIVSVQNEYNLLRRHFDLDLAELSHHEDVGLLAYSPLAGGLITGKYFDGQMPKGSRGDYQKSFWRLNEQSEAAGKQYLALAERHGLDVSQMAIAFALTRPFMTSVIIGATSTAQLANAIAAHKVTLSPELIAEIDAIHRRYPRTV
ncbi:MAG: aldo/keto reductase [Alphaproteobacteria bacterium]|nr:aldo/keto reductase [Alphaproteobacteria bacterium]MBU1560179.1 aldo/keto reductase [Alphaproteobacteria bacterium]MBU2303267.1 aldo/keto reductase [Alphaproteobacteria bacterium]MBU2370297.1 aldo/keto reductase [Alphaproteobacteria bacterium]